MNHFKKEEIKKLQNEREDLISEQIKDLDVENNAIQKLARKIHIERFPEEYDFMYDDHVDVSDRRKGTNPMSSEYIEKTREKRKRLNVSQLSENGMPESTDTWELCLQEAKKECRELRTRIDEIMFYKWNPLQLSNSNWPRYEYEFYVPEVYRLALESTSYHPISDYLTYVNTKRMLSRENKDHDIEIAKLIFALAKDQSYFPDHRGLENE